MSLVQIICKGKTNRSELLFYFLFLWMYTGRCHMLVPKGTVKGKWFKLFKERDDVALFYEKA